MSDLFVENIPAMNAGEAVEKLTELYSRVIENGLAVSSLPSIMLWGPPGTGKSQAVHQMADRVGVKTGKKVQVRDVRLLLFNPIDLRGIPVANADKSLAIWLKPQIFQMDPGEDIINILFLDEISAAPQSVQAAAYQITLDRVIGEHRLPDNCIVIAARNRVTDRSVAYKMPKALANRLMHISIINDFESWRKWAVTAGINPKVIGFLAFRRDYLQTKDLSTDDLAFPTPRTWEMVSNLLNCINGSVADMYAMVAGLVGSGAAVEFLTWEKVYKDLPDLRDIFDGKNPKIPSEPDCLYALTAAMTNYARKHKNDVHAIANSIVYADRMPPDFSTILMRDYMYLGENFKMKLLKIPEFQKWLHTKGVLLNGVV